ncbi:MAG: hypothetical protein R3249_09800 [Nitriliruptorales bacterium]|nr:hypothetical protein [Nitriliruptorales bacterium]
MPDPHELETYNDGGIAKVGPVMRSRVVKSEQVGDTSDQPEEGARVCGECGQTWPFGTLECPDDGTLLIQDA